MRRGSRFNASDLSYHQQSSKSTATVGDRTTVTEVPPRGRDVASRVALLASIPLDTQMSPSRQEHKDQSVEVTREGRRHRAMVIQSPAEHGRQSVEIEDCCRPVSDDDDEQLANTEESRSVRSLTAITACLLVYFTPSSYYSVHVHSSVY